MDEEFDYIEGCREDVCINVTVFVYNHSSYLRQALDSIFMQKTQYSYNVIVGEDCSTDDSRDILMEYYNKYPDKMNLILWKHNTGGMKNDVEILKKCKGKYVAYLEGDDYWTDPLKLEKQVSFLEKNNQYIGTVHNIKCVDKNGSFLHRDFGLYPYQEEHIYGWSDAKTLRLPGQTASLLHRNIWKEYSDSDWKKYLKCKSNGDIKICVILASIGDIYFLCDIMAAHRRVFDEGDSWTAQVAGKNMLWFNYQIRCELQRYMKEAYNADMQISIKNIVQSYFEESVIQMLYHPSKENFNILWKFYREKMHVKK